MVSLFGFTACYGSFGHNCSLRCPDGFYGHGCRQKCDCVNNQKCDPKSGCILWKNRHGMINLILTCKEKLNFACYSFGVILSKVIVTKLVNFMTPGHHSR